ncbi:MAG TPA: DUF4115 domain-containing protein [Acidimicrobiales bacterium]|nr:DUF4115 domain-containing protein [Acidimicrobiales bacterium]
MTAVAILGLIALVGVAVAWTSWHRVADERRSVQNHQHALDTMRHLGDHHVSALSTPDRHDRQGASRARARPDAAPARRGPAAWSHAEAPVAVPAPRPAPRRAGPRRPARRPSGSAGKPNERRSPAMVFVDDSAPPAGATPAPERVPYRTPWAERLGPVGRRHPGRNALAAAGAGAVAVAVVLAVTIPSTRPPGRHPSSSPHRVVTPLRSSRAPGRGAAGTTASTPAPSAVLPVTATAHSARYALGAGSGATLVLTATGLCWVLVSDQPSGSPVWTGVLSAGQSRTVAVSGSVQLRLGAASDVVVSANGRLVALPPGYQSPFDMDIDVGA